MKNKSVGNLENNSNLIQGKKRGRKSKKEIEEAKKIIECNEQPVLNKITNDNIIVNIEDNLNIDNVSEILCLESNVDSENDKNILNEKI